MATSLSHLFVRGTVTSVTYKSVLSGGTPPTQQRRDRQTHSQHLLRQLATLVKDEERLALLREASNVPSDAGMTVAIEVTPKGALNFASLEWVRDGIQVLSVIGTDVVEIVTVHVPRGKLSAFEKRVREYMTKNNKPKKDGSIDPAHAALVNAISNFRLAVFEELWTDSDDPPAEKNVTWFQVWLRLTGLSATATRAEFVERTAGLEITVDSGYVSFPGRVVIAVQATRAALQKALDLLDLVAEIRSVKPTASFYLADLTPFERAQWVNNLRSRTQFPQRNSRSYVTLLDTGVSPEHPLLSGGLHEDDLHAVDAEWQVSDHEGHGTGMAGLSLLGDLTVPLSGDAPYLVEHRLESVKILPPQGANAPHLYGSVTAEAVNIVERAHENRDRTFAMMTTSQGETKGVPSEWSAQVDRLAFGIKPDDDGSQLKVHRNPKMFVLAGGNIEWIEWDQYPTCNTNLNVENPGQSWNALTVGAYTNLTAFDKTKWPSLTTISPPGGLSPSSRTSVTWDTRWPFKPDVVAEGGNACLDSKLGGVTVGPADLRLLTTSHNPLKSLLAESGDTSAATAEVARICGLLQTRYPNYWPETHRALIVHGARWTPTMRGAVTSTSAGWKKRTLVRKYGYGAVNLERSTVSHLDEATLVLQENITPYVIRDGSTKLGNLNLHALPWPANKLLELESQAIELRITLSYFVEPNPAQRGWQSKFRYQSHGLRFAVKAASEDLPRFLQRINKLERKAAEVALATEEEDSEQGGERQSIPDPDVGGWFLGAKLRGQGSIHSDVWSGNARALAEKSHIAVYPVGGWWKDWKGGGRQNASTRYSLVVTLHVLGDISADIYTPIANQIGIVVPPVEI